MVNNTTNLELNKQLNNTNIQGFENSDIKKQFSDTEVSNAYNINPEAANFEPASSTKKQHPFGNQNITTVQSDSTNVDIPKVQSFSTSSSSDVQSETDFSDNTENPVNCLSLTVRKDYSLSVVKHVLVRTWKTTWRVALSIFLLNFLSFFF